MRTPSECCREKMLETFSFAPKQRKNNVIIMVVLVIMIMMDSITEM